MVLRQTGRNRGRLGGGKLLKKAELHVWRAEAGGPQWGQHE